MTETAYPLAWPSGWKRTLPTKRESAAPFSVGEEREKTERVYDAAQATFVTKTRKVQGSKKVTIAIAVDRLEDQLARLEGQLPVLSTNLETRLNGLPRGGQKNPSDPGAAVYFTLKGRRVVFACDKWTEVADNIAALAAHIRAIRSVKRFGVGTIEQAFRGYTALENFSDGIPWRRVLGFKDDEPVTCDQVEAKYRERMKAVHPDMTGGSGLQAQQLNLAIAQARTEVRG